MRAPKTARKQPDRVQGRQFHLTYAALYPGELTHASIQAAAEAWAVPVAKEAGPQTWAKD